MPQSIHFFSGFKNGLKMMVSDLNHLPGRVKRSDLVQSGRDTSPDVVRGANTGPRVIYHGYTTLGTSRKHSFGAHLGSFGPLEASRGQTRQTMVGIKVVYGKLEQVGSVQRARK